MLDAIRLCIRVSASALQSLAIMGTTMLLLASTNSSRAMLVKARNELISSSRKACS